MKPKKSLGQHWLRNTSALIAICDAAGINKNDVVLEVGPGPGTLTKHLVDRAKKVIAVELDENLAKKLPQNINSRKLKVINQDVLTFDLATIGSPYKVVANIPYYLTGNLLRFLSESNNPPSKMALLVQKEVAERVSAQPGQMSVLAVSVQLYYNANLGQIIPAKMFNPPPKVDSQVLILDRHDEPIFPNLDSKIYFRVVKAGFSARRKKLRSSLSGGLGISKKETDAILEQAQVDAGLRAQNLDLDSWYRIAEAWHPTKLML